MNLRKVSRGSTEDDFIDTRVNYLIDEIVNMTEERFKAQNVHFEVNYHDIFDNSLIQCQRLQISQVLFNLVNNTYDAIQDNEE